VSVVDLRVYRDPAFTPLVIIVDPQQEYVSTSRALGMPHSAGAIENCRSLLAFARQQGFPVCFTRWQLKGKFFGEVDNHSAWIEALSPRGSDMIFERSLPSCYANERFAAMMANGGGDNAVIAGFTGTIACLSTLVDAYHRSHSVAFLSDASASHRLPSLSHDAAHGFIAEVIALYSPVMTTAQWIHQQTSSRKIRIGGGVP
jgi:nicotinamidase-related amidase